MARQACPECRHKISQQAKFCPHCGFSFEQKDLEKLRQLQQERYQLNQQQNRQNNKVQFIWLVIFSIVIMLASYFFN